MMNDIELFELYDFYYTPFWQERWFFAGCGLVAVISLGFLAFWLFRYYKKAHRIMAFETISGIKALPQDPQRAQQFYEKLSYLLKYYFADHYKEHLYAATDREFLERLCLLESFSEHELQVLKNIFLHAEPIRFAGDEGRLEVMQEVAECSIALISRHYASLHNKSARIGEIVG